jgi:hypothetical protein
LKKILYSCLICLCSQVKAQTNNALQFNGTTQFVNIGNPLSSTTSYTKEAWVFATSTGSARHIISSTNATFGLNAGVLSAGHSGSFSAVSDVTSLPLNRWVHVAVTYDQPTTTMKLYRDGIIVGINTAVASYTDETNYIGSFVGTSGYFEGKVDEVRIWNVALSQVDLKKHIFSGPNKSMSGLTRLYKFNESSGIELIDSVAGVHGDLIGSPNWTSSPIQGDLNALSFDGINDHVVLPHSISTDFTVEYWMKTTQTASSGLQWYHGAGVVDAEMASELNDWGTSLNGNKICFGVGQPDITIFSSTVVNTGDWFHIAVTRNQATGKMILYVNGVEEASAFGSLNTRTAPTGISLGRLLTGIQYFSGSIDEVRVWDVVRTPAQIASNMNAEISKPELETNLVAYYPMNQGITGGNNSGISQLIDIKNSNNGSIYNFNFSGSSSNYIGQFTGITSLPLNWLSFDAKQFMNKAHLTWSITNDWYGKDFVVLHSKSGSDWKEIGIIQKKASIELECNYSFIHETPVNGNNFYRILQRDLNSKQIYSPVRELVFTSHSSNKFQFNNPVNNGLLTIEVSEFSDVSVMNLDGKLLWQGNTLQGVLNINLSWLPAGVYLLNINQNVMKLTVL